MYNNFLKSQANCIMRLKRSKLLCKQVFLGGDDDDGAGTRVPVEVDVVARRREYNDFLSSFASRASFHSNLIQIINFKTIHLFMVRIFMTTLSSIANINAGTKNYKKIIKRYNLCYTNINRTRE